MSKYTPGPWVVTSYSRNEHVIEAIWGGQKGELSDHIAKFEDAQLAAASPDLLEALYAGPSTLHTLPRGEVCNCSQCQFVRLRSAAIAKATRGTP